VSTESKQSYIPLFPKDGITKDILDQSGSLASSGMELTLSASSTLTITYGYDPLERLTSADYSDGSFFHYSYDAAGNRLSETTHAEGNVYTYDDANRLASLNGVAYAWDANGNLLSDRVNTYTYDAANRLTGVTDGVSAVSYAYNGLGDRLQTTAAGQTTRYTLDLVSGLTQVLDDGGYTYLYGNGRIAQYGASGGEYFLGDALGSVRQLVNDNGEVLLTQSYQPYGELLASIGNGESVYGFTGEATDALTGMVYLRARWYAPQFGRFTSRDPWDGDYYQPMSYNAWLYVYNNPINYTDPSGHICVDPWAPSGVHLDPNRGCDYPEGSKGSFWWRRDPLGPDTAIIDMPWVDEQSQKNWNRYPNSCGASALYMFLQAEGILVDFDVMVQHLQNERPGGYNGYCCHNSVSDASGTSMLPTATPDPLAWCNKACVSGEALASVARKYYGLDIIAGDNWTHQQVFQKVSRGHPVLTLIRSELTTTYFGHFVVIKGFSNGGWTVLFNDSYPGEAYWDVRGGSSEIRREIGEGREAEWDDFDASWASHVDNMDPMSPGGHVRWGMAVR
jgi:RHS repeat-associated protein